MSAEQEIKFEEVILSGSQDVLPSIFPHSAVILVNSYHYCDGFEEGEDERIRRHSRRCLELRTKGICSVVGLGRCQVVPAEELAKYFPEVTRATSRITHPFGDLDGGRDDLIRVVIPQGRAV